MDARGPAPDPCCGFDRARDDGNCDRGDMQDKGEMKAPDPEQPPVGLFPSLYNRAVRRTDVRDTTIEMHKARIHLLREKSPVRKIRSPELVELSCRLFPEQTKVAVRESFEEKRRRSKA